MTQGEQNLSFLQKALPTSEKLYIWCYSVRGSLLAASSPDREIFPAAFSILGGLDRALDYAKEQEKSLPLLIGSAIGMHWAITYEAARNQELIFAVGPVFYQPPYENELREGLRQYTGSREGAAWASLLMARLHEMPVMSYAVFTRYATIVHNTLNGEQLGLDGMTPLAPPIVEKSDPPELHDRVRVYLNERAILQMVRNGDINYQSVLQQSIDASPGIPVRGKDPLRQAKTSVTVFTSLVCRAAVEGGLSPEIAYPLGDSYIQAVEDCRDSGEISFLCRAMYNDFILRVHRLRTNTSLSHPIRKCCDYIELNLDKKIRAADLATLVGYTEYYLTEKFKKETGLPISSYIRFAKIERAKILLTSTDLSVQEIAERLAFTTPNYFIHCFKEVTGYSPAQYRKRFLNGA